MNDCIVSYFLSLRDVLGIEGIVRVACFFGIFNIPNVSTMQDLLLFLQLEQCEWEKFLVFKFKTSNMLADLIFQNICYSINIVNLNLRDCCID